MDNDVFVFPPNLEHATIINHEAGADTIEVDHTECTTAATVLANGTSTTGTVVAQTGGAGVAFGADSTGTLTPGDSQAYNGTVAGNYIDLADISFGAHTTLGYTPNNSNGGGVLTAGDGDHVAKIALLGQYAAASFAMASDGHAGPLITDPLELIAQTQLTKPHG
jgi:hypothetical protein